MPPHSSHLLQLLDVGCFSPLKHAYRNQVANSMQLGRNYIDKLDFLEAFKIARAKALDSSNIRSGFIAAGLVFFDPERVLSRLRFKLRTPTPPEAAMAARQTPKTPHNIAQVDQKYTTLKGLLNRSSKSPPNSIDRALGRVVKRCKIAIYNAALLASEIKDLRAINARQTRKRAAPRSYIATGGVLTAEEDQGRVKKTRITDKAVLDGGGAQASTRAPPRCNIYSSLEHNARVCSMRIV
jgi:hypothetical protein